MPPTEMRQGRQCPGFSKELLHVDLDDLPVLAGGGTRTGRGRQRDIHRLTLSWAALDPGVVVENNTVINPIVVENGTDAFIANGTP